MKAIMAVCGDNFGYGFENDLPWGEHEDCTRDMKNFIKLTKGQIVLMGSKTMESLPKFPLASRLNVVASNDAAKIVNIQQLHPDVVVTSGAYVDLLETRLKAQHTDKEEVWCIGGGTLLKECIAYVTEFHLTKFHFDDIKSDIYFDDSIITALEDDFRVSRKTITKYGTEFIVYTRKVKEEIKKGKRNVKL